ncbi:hypothetical protein C0Q70_06720 [Pomacea canaliculata]|uniref:non-specific serine/threonine protein kinase n=1 Tax=Pomacea canaliculata TaxID=400727 RepID=A0A2T7PD19_POMCA|nr:serine/threonine-protein kinase 36-like isoform X2 [Pomacea canaliculata]PVD31308.1 hypothetical protein C0Q70_06720 [Pomacea canaliculata]
MDNYHVLEIIGEGSFGKVYKGRRKYTGQIVALKFIPKVGKSDKELRGLRREIEIMRGLHHDNIIEMLDSFDTDKEVVVVTDYAEGELFQILEDDGSLPEEQVQIIATQLVSALFYLHSHRILHRDMKPQNILLGRGGTVKLCDFGFARGMSTNTLVLTSIKGTPLYMSPELVEEKPYDHTADLWALGCILYELFVGTPPFYTNSIFQLVTMIIKDPVKWPKNMSSTFKDFLQGLLSKNPRHRLSWPDLLHHPFVAANVKVSEADSLLESPFTQPLSASMMVLKEKQSREKAHPPGTSKILARARRKAMEEEDKKKVLAGLPVEPRPQAWEQDQTDAAIREGKEGEGLNVWETTGISKNMEPTPRLDRISKDYKKEYPSIEVEGRRTLKKKNDQKNIENVKLDGEEVDSEDEWQSLIEATDQDGNPDVALRMLTDPLLIERFRVRLETSSTHVLEGTLEGAARLRSVLRVITNLVTLKCDVSNIIAFTNKVAMPGKILQVLGEILTISSVKEQPWAQQILIDLVITLNAYFASEISWSDNVDKLVIDEYDSAVKQFLELVPELLSQQIDADLRLREQTLLCIIYLSEAMDRSSVSRGEPYYQSLVSEHVPVLDVILQLSRSDPQTLKNLCGLPEVPQEMALERLEQMVGIAAGCLATFVNIPLQGKFATDGKKKVAEYLGEKLTKKEEQEVASGFLLLLHRPADCSTVLKVIYACCQASESFCTYICETETHLESLLALLMGKVEVADMEINTVVEMVLYILCCLVIQVQHLPDRLAGASAMLVSIFLDSTLASHTAAAALLFGQMVACGMSCEVQPDEMLQACLAVFTDLAEVCVRCPFEFGILDGLLLLLCELLPQTDMPVAQLYIETGIWAAMWHRVAQAMQVTALNCNLPIHDIEVEGQDEKKTWEFIPPGWDLLSPQGLMAALQIAISVFTKETYQCLPNLSAPDGVLMLTLVHLLQVQFLDSILIRYKQEGKQLQEDLILAVTQLGCFPFAVDASEDLLAEIQHCLYTVELLPRLLGACVRCLNGEALETPIGLVTRMVLGNAIFVHQFAAAVRELNCTGFLCSCLSENSPLSVICDVVSILSHLVRTSPEHLILVMLILQGTKGDFAILTTLMNHSTSVVRSRICSLLGNLMKHDAQLYPVLLQREKILAFLISCLQDEDSNVRKCSAYALGNASYHSAQLYPRLKVAIPALVQLLSDPVSKIKVNAASALGNLGMHSSLLCPDLMKTKVMAHLLETACHDTQPAVQDSALLALRSLCQQEELRKELVSLKAAERLSSLTVVLTPRTDSQAVSPRPETRAGTRPASSHSLYTSATSNSIVSHCNRLIRVLQAHS